MNNLHISYDLYAPGKNYDDLIAKIKTLGDWAKIHKSFWYVKSSLSATQAFNALEQFLDANDKLYIVDATNNSSAWNRLSDEVSSFIKKQWNQKSLLPA